MGLPKRKNNINIYQRFPSDSDTTNRRQELLDEITINDTFLPDPISHDDLDMGMLEFVKTKLQVNTDKYNIPIIPRILTIQRWGEISNTWEYTTDEGNIQIPFIVVVRKPEVLPGTNPVIQRNVPDNKLFYYQKVQTWNGNLIGADIYKIPQPVAVDINYSITIVCNTIRETNIFNKVVLTEFASRQSYSKIKGHYIPIIFNDVNDSTPINELDGRRFYVQTYNFTMLGYILDSEDFEVTPSVSRALLLSEYDNPRNNNLISFSYDNLVRYITINYLKKPLFESNEPITQLIEIIKDGQSLELNTDYYYIQGSNRIGFNTNLDLSNITIIYYSNKNGLIDNITGNPIELIEETFNSSGGTISISSSSLFIPIILVNNILYNSENYNIVNNQEITFLVPLNIGDIIIVKYFK